ncbi:glycosyltransferase family 39 protein [Candidatus Daviesbacteria bacterium]|nr:glycosyltransferase family 39 protein [Candidatus Daviesbacteria bacterium]
MAKLSNGKKKFWTFLKYHWMLISILILAGILRLIGLFPNTLLHQDEPALLGPSQKLLEQILFQANFDPNIPPQPFKYGSFLYYLHALIHGVVLSVIYLYELALHKLTIYSAMYKDQVDYWQFITNTGLANYRDVLLWFDRASGALFGVASVWLTYLIGKQLFCQRLGLLAALLLAVNPLHVRESHYATVDVPQLFFILLSFLFSFFVLKKPSVKWFAWAGFMAGFTTSIKYFPLALLPLFFFHLLNIKKPQDIYQIARNLVVSLVFVWLGFWAGSPYLPFHFKEVTEILQIHANYYGSDKYNQPNLITNFLPTSAHFFHIGFLIDEAYLALPLAATIVGVVMSILSFGRLAITLLVIPLVNFLIIFGYVAPIYERLLLPGIPFMALFNAVFLDKALGWLRLKFTVTGLVMGLLLIVATIGPSLQKSLAASLACGQPIADYAARDWIKQHFALGTRLAYQPGIRIPEIGLDLIRSEIATSFSLMELQEQPAEYLIITSGYLDRFKEWAADFPVTPVEEINNLYPVLVFQEYQKTTQLVQEFVKPSLCVDNRIYIFKLFPILGRVNNKIKQFSFMEAGELSDWRLVSWPSSRQHAVISFVARGHDGAGALRYHFPHSNLNPTDLVVAEPIFSPMMEITGGARYSASAWVKPEVVLSDSISDGFVRLDFYDQLQGQPIATALSSRARPNSQWQELVVTATAPKGARFATVGFGSFNPYQAGSFLIDEVKLAN